MKGLHVMKNTSNELEEQKKGDANLKAFCISQDGKAYLHERTIK
jgi:hypothetical protein